MASGDSSRMPPRPRYRVRTGFAPCCRERILRACLQLPNDSSSAFRHVNPPMQTRDQTEMVHGGIREYACLGLSDDFIIWRWLGAFVSAWGVGAGRRTGLAALHRCCDRA